MISLDYGLSADPAAGNVFRLKIVRGTDESHEDRDRARSINGRVPRYVPHPEKPIDILTHWEIPAIQVAEICNAWKPHEMLITPEAQEQVDRFHSLSIPLDTLDEIPEEEITWERSPLPHQRRYICINRSKTKLMCSWKLGLGKTFGALKRANVMGFNRLVIVCPNKTMTNWITECRETFGDQYRVIKYHGSIAQRAKLKPDLASANIIVTSFEMVHEINEESYDQIIIDEAHLISRMTARRTQSCETLVRRNYEAGLQLLTGTPIMHKIPDLWTLVYLLCPELAGTQTAWTDRYVKDGKMIQKKMPNGKIGWFPANQTIINADELKSRVAPLLVRVGYEGITKFKDQQEIITVDMTERQRRLYDRIRKDILLELDNRTLSLQSALVRMLRLLQAAEGAFNIDEKWKDSGKFDYICQELDNSDDKVVVWSRFQPITNRLYEKYKDRAVLFNGSVSQKRQDLGVWSFQGVTNEFDRETFEKYRKSDKEWTLEPGEAQFFFGVIDPRSSLGINLHACSRQIFSSFHWNGNAMMQAKGRLTRYGQQATEVHTDYVVAVDTFEKQALSLILKNYQQTLEVLDGQRDRTHQKMSELLNILRNV